MKYFHSMVSQLSSPFSPCHTEALNSLADSCPGPLPQPLAPTTPLSVNTNWTTPVPHVSGTTQSFVLLWLAHFTQQDAFKVHARHSRWQDFLLFLRLNNIPLYASITFFLTQPFFNGLLSYWEHCRREYGWAPPSAKAGTSARVHPSGKPRAHIQASVTYTAPPPTHQG